ncbi:response regulator [Nonlabens ponticola]|uniref:Response regulator n=1 Tax=Nonlabens ponticola TaxID=2496866 RepID=A0A3S9MWG4_9FLAO|nr:response regulator [Nonlabens ponticola]AZQ43469.1 response regulator [Nonlabens ponticola]
MATPLVPKVCIIDDDRLYVSLIGMLLEKHHIADQFTVFENGAVAIDHFKEIFESNDTQELPDVILLDLNMPVMNGWEFLDNIEPYASQLLESGVRLNVVSSTINPEEVKRAQEHSIVHHFITKPISKEAIMRAVKD